MARIYVESTPASRGEVDVRQLERVAAVAEELGFRLVAILDAPDPAALAGPWGAALGADSGSAQITLR